MDKIRSWEFWDLQTLESYVEDIKTLVKTYWRNTDHKRKDNFNEKVLLFLKLAENLIGQQELSKILKDIGQDTISLKESCKNLYYSDILKLFDKIKIILKEKDGHKKDENTGKIKKILWKILNKKKWISTETTSIDVKQTSVDVKQTSVEKTENIKTNIITFENIWKLLWINKSIDEWNLKNMYDYINKLNKNSLKSFVDRIIFIKDNLQVDGRIKELLDELKNYSTKIIEEKTEKEKKERTEYKKRNKLELEKKERIEKIKKTFVQQLNIFQNIANIQDNQDPKEIKKELLENINLILSNIKEAFGKDNNLSYPIKKTEELLTLYKWLELSRIDAGLKQWYLFGDIYDFIIWINEYYMLNLNFSEYEILDTKIKEYKSL